MTRTLTHLERLEAESIHIMREVVAEAEKPVMLYSVGKDSAVMLHLARKAFYPSPPPFPLLHVDTTWKFKAMYALRDELLNGEIFYSLAEARVLIEAWRRHYNTVRPHSSLGYRPPAPEAVPSPVPSSGSASLHLRPTLAMEMTMH
jgi:hypothetical protein